MRLSDIIILGDVNLDYCALGNLDFAFPSLVENGRVTWQTIEERPGGTGLNFALHARERGYKPFLIGCIGDDYAGRYLWDCLSQMNLNEGIVIYKNNSTGKAIIVRDSNDVRLLIDNNKNANHFLSMTDIEEHSETIKNASMLYISGYCIRDRSVPRFRAVQRAVEIAEGSQTVIIFDVVPHKIYEKYSLDEFRRVIPRIDILISEVATIRRFLGMGTPDETINETVGKETLEVLKKYYSRFILRWGPSGVDQEIIWDGLSGQMFTMSHDHKSAKDKRGFGDQIALDVIKNIFGFKPDLSSDFGS